MDFDYYQLRGKWNAATLNRRAEKLEEAQAAADELEEAGANGVEIIGVKAGKRETLRGKKKAPKAAKVPKEKKAPAKKKKAAKGKKTAVKMTGTTGTYTTDYKTEKKAKAAAQNIRKLGYKTEIVEPDGQLDLFDVMKDDKKKVLYSFTQIDVNSLITAFYSLIQAGEKLPAGYKSILTTFEKSDTTGNVKIEFSYNEIKLLIKICQMYLRKFISDKGKSNIYKTIQELKKLFLMWIY